MKTTAIILSGGKGTRFGSDLPKQYTDLNGRPVLAYTLQAFQSSSVDAIVIVAAGEYLEHCREIAASIGCTKLAGVVPGGKERYDSVLQGLRHVKEQIVPAEEAETALVLIHDGARPCIRAEVIDRIIRETFEYGAVIAGTPCTDTIKLVDEQGFITGTTKRRLTWAAQTPQAFRLQEITAAYETVIGALKPEELAGRQITDDAMVFQSAFPDRKVRMLDAGPSNIKITNAEDLSRARGILET